MASSSKAVIKSPCFFRTKQTQNLVGVDITLVFFVKLRFGLFFLGFFFLGLVWLHVRVPRRLSRLFLSCFDFLDFRLHVHAGVGADLAPVEVPLLGHGQILLFLVHFFSVHLLLKLLSLQVGQAPLQHDWLFDGALLLLLVVLAYLNDFRTSWLRARRTGRPVVVGVQLIVLVRGGGIAVLVVRTRPTSSATPRAARAALGVILLPRQPVILKWVVRWSVICVSNQVLVDSNDCVNLMLVSAAVDGVGGYGSLQGGSGASSAAADTLAAVAVVKVIVFVLGCR